MPNSTARKPSLPKKPRKDFPLFPHRNGQWCKKIRGRQHYFGVWADWDGAEKLWVKQKDALLAGLVPRDDGSAGGLQLHELVNDFLASKESLVDTGELKRSTFNEYFRTCSMVTAFLHRDRLVSDTRPEDFARLRVYLAKGLGLPELGKRIGIVRSVFKHGTENQLITHAVVFGKGFKKPTQKALRIERAASPSRMLTAAELQSIIGAAGVQMKAMILLGLNAGFGNTDIAELPIAAIENGWVRFPRPKTGMPRKCSLWPETIDAVKAAKAARVEPAEKADAHRLFITQINRAAWVRHQPAKKGGGWTWVDGVNLEFKKLLTELKLKRPGVSFYSLRHVFRTIADKVNDRPAIDVIMGHVPETGDMGPRYVDSIEDERVQKITDHVRTWLLAKVSKKTKAV